MRVFTGYESALEYWRIKCVLPNSGVVRTRNITLPSTIPTAAQARSAGLGIPVHIMLSNPNYRWPTKTIIQHVFSGKTPAGCFLYTDNGLEVSSPEFCFLQMAEKLPLPRLIELGYELCGTYSLPAAGDHNATEIGFNQRQPLTSLKKLSVFVAEMPGFNGHVKAVRALRYILEGSASPMESKLAILLTLPYKLGGFGMPKPELNVRIALTKTAEKVAGKKFYVCDLFWPDRNIAVEYDSDSFHAGQKQIADDSKKRNTLTIMGIKVLSITTQQLFSPIDFERAAGAIANCIGKRLVYKNPGFMRANNSLREQLLYYSDDR